MDSIHKKRLSEQEKIGSFLFYILDVVFCMKADLHHLLNMILGVCLKIKRWNQLRKGREKQACLRGSVMPSHHIYNTFVSLVLNKSS